ncbi:unnamed protein product [Cercospora beticola]|nr:unnamed protein product [Cercospora beticola]
MRLHYYVERAGCLPCMRWRLGALQPVCRLLMKHGACVLYNDNIPLLLKGGGVIQAQSRWWLPHIELNVWEGTRGSWIGLTSPQYLTSILEGPHSDLSLDV